MRFFVPDLKPAPERAASSSGLLLKLFGQNRGVSDDQTAMRERLGGVPFGLPASAWPTCSECGKSQSLLAQFEHHAQRLDLGREGRTLMVFQCNHDPGMCATWEAFSGANACLVVEPEDLGDAETSVPADQPPLENCAFVTQWLARTDPIPEDLADQFYDDATYLLLEPSLRAQVTWSTRLGGVPSWIQSPNEAPGPEWRFIGQLDSTYSFLQPPDPSPSWVAPDPEAYEGRTDVGAGPNFGDGGIAYLFLREGEQRPDVAMFWQCG